MFKTMFSETARTIAGTVAGAEPAASASPLGGNYVAVFDRPQARAEGSGGRYTASFDGPAGNRAARSVDSYVAVFNAGRPAPRRRGSYVDAER